MPDEDKREKGLKVNLESKESKELAMLLDLINTPASKQQLPSIRWGPDENQNHAVPSWVGSPSSTAAHHHQSTEAVTLEQFSSKYYGIRNFSSHPQQAYFGQIFTALVKQRVCCQEWIQRAPPENILRALICLRMLMRDAAYQTEFFTLGGVKILSERLQLLTESYLENGEEQFTVDILKEMTNICQKLSADVKQREWLVACGTHKALVLLLSASDVIVLHCSLYALISLAQSERPRGMIGELNCIETLLRILQDYDILSKTLAANLLRILCADGGMREQIKVFDGIPICLSLLHCENLKLLWHVVWIIVQMAEDTDSSNDIRLLGGIPLLLALLQDRKFFSSETGQELSSGDHSRSSTGQELESDPMEEVLSLKSAACAALSELVLNDTNGQQIVQSNGVYLLGILILPSECSTNEEASAAENLQKNAFRALRFLFSMERNRQLFKRLFPPDLFEKFIDVGHYVKELGAYKPLVEMLNSLSEEDIAVIRSNIQATNQNKAPSHMVGAYAVHELLGSGAFGSVYKVQKRHGAQTFYAMKEISIHNQFLGKTAKERGKSVGEIVNECTIMKEQMRHPNVVRYYKAFEEKDKLYVIMELVEGAPLGEHFNSLIEKKACFGEERLWHIFIQLVLGLRYIHKEKHIIHRDLTPNNIMLGENDKVTITDFGLAKQRNPDASKMTSVVGTILYSCPEVVQSQPYGEKADVWAAGCILYQMATLRPPFYSSNMLALATKIVEAQYEPIPPGQYSDRVSAIVNSCLKPKPDERPDIVGVAAQMSDIMLIYMDKMKKDEINLEKKLDRERKRTQRHYLEANRNMQNYHRLFWASQERYDKLMSLSSSGGASSLRTVPDGSDSVFEMAEEYADHQHALETESAPRRDSSYVFNSADSGCVLDINSNISNNSEQNGGNISSTTSPNIFLSNRYKKELKPVITDKTNLPKAKNGEITHSPRRTQIEKLDGVSRSNSDASSLSSKVLGDKTHNFAVPKPRVARKGARRHLNMDLPAVSKPNASIATLNSPSVVGTASAPIPSPSAVDIAYCRRSQSSSAVETYRRQNSGQLKARPPTAAATLSISPRKVRQISDPILQILHQLHKIIFITQLPPTLSPNPQRRIIERFKRALFAPQSSSFNLKSELKKVIEGSRELIDLKFGFGDPSYLHQQDNTEKLVSSIGLETADGQEIGISYENMQTIIENVLMESGYYDMSPNVRNRSVPLGPIGTVPAASHR